MVVRTNLAGVLSTFASMMADGHALEKSWWLENPPDAAHLPPSSLMSFTKVTTVQSEGELRVAINVPQRCIIQIGSQKLHLHAKWLPLMMLIQLIQAAALDASITASRIQKQSNSANLRRLMWFYDFLLKQFAQDVIGKTKSSGNHAMIPDNWMPESMHRCLTRMELQIPHSPAALEKNAQRLDEAYQNRSDHFSYGRNWFTSQGHSTVVC